MPCFCTETVLRTFVRNVAHLELTPASQFANYQSITKRGISTALRERIKDRSTFKSRSTENTSRTPYSRAPDRNPVTSISQSQDGSYNFKPQSISKTQHDEGHGGDDAVIMDISPGAIDALAAESIQTTRRPTRDSTISRTPGMSPNSFTISRTGSRSETISKTESQREERSTARLRSKAEEPWVPPPREPWQTQKAALKEKFGSEGWNPRKKLSPDALTGIRAIHAQFPEQYTTAVLSEKFEVSPEVIRRILKSKWEPNDEEKMDRDRRWFARGEKVWSRFAEEKGMKPPKRWRMVGVGREVTAKVIAQKEKNKLPQSITTERRGPVTTSRVGDSQGLSERLL